MRIIIRECGRARLQREPLLGVLLCLDVLIDELSWLTIAIEEIVRMSRAEGTVLIMKAGKIII
jgi:hypothetical protein